MSDHKNKNEDMIPEKPKNDDRNVEWSFDFATLGDNIRRIMGSFSENEEVDTSDFVLERGDYNEAYMDINFSIGTGRIYGLTDTAELFNAHLVHIGEVALKTSPKGERIDLKLEQPMKASIVRPIRQGFRALADKTELRWDVGISPDIPLKLDVDGGVGPVTLDLSNLNINHLEVDSGVGTMHITMPTQSSSYRAEIDGGVGETRIIIPASNGNHRIDIDGGIGMVEVSLPESAACQIIASSGLGGVTIPKHFERVSGKGDFMDRSGVWQTPGFELASNRIMINYDGGVGQFTVRVHEVI